jgi:hypothetical protein
MPGPLFLSTLAAELGVEADALVPAARTAAGATISAMVEAGDVPADVGERMIDRIESATGDGCAVLGMRFAHGLRAAGVADWLRDSADAAADALGIDVSDLRQRMRAGESLEAIAEAEGVSYATVSAAVLAATEADLDAAVEAGRMTQAWADRVLERVSDWLAGGGEPRRHLVGD